MFSLFRKEDSSLGAAQPGPLATDNQSDSSGVQAASSESTKVAEPTTSSERIIDAVAPAVPSSVADSSQPAAEIPQVPESSSAHSAPEGTGSESEAEHARPRRQLWEYLLEGFPNPPAESTRETSELDSDSSDVPPIPRRMPRVRGKRLARPDSPDEKKRSHTPQQRLLLLDSWRRSGLPAGDFAALVGISKHTLYKWNQQFEQLGPEGLLDQPRRARSSGRLPELTKRTILMLKESHPEWGCERISDMLLRGPALGASPSSVARVLHEAGYELIQEPTRAHPDKVRRFERAKPNQLWQTDLFTFMLKRQNRRVHLVAFMDDHSRFIVSYGLHATASTALVIEAMEAGIHSYGPPEEVLTDNGPQYVTWRGKSQFTRRLEQHGIRQIVARPRRPQTLGKIERFWGTLWREFLETAVFVDMAEARARIGLFIDYFNFQRVHSGIDGLVPADRFFGAATEVARTLKERVAANSLELARHGEPRAPFYVTGQLDGQSFSVHAEGPRLILTRPGQSRQEVEFTSPRGDPANTAGDPAPQSVGANSRADSQPLPTPVCPEGSPAGDLGSETVEEVSSPEQEAGGGA